MRADWNLLLKELQNNKIYFLKCNNTHIIIDSLNFYKDGKISLTSLDEEGNHIEHIFAYHRSYDNMFNIIMGIYR